MVLRYPDSRKFLSSVELAQQVEEERQRADLELFQKELAQQGERSERLRAEQEETQKELAQQRAE